MPVVYIALLKHVMRASHGDTGKLLTPSKTYFDRSHVYVEQLTADLKVHDK